MVCQIEVSDMSGAKESADLLIKQLPGSKQMCTEILSKKKPSTLMFETKNKLSSGFDHVGKHGLQLVFGLPYVKPPNMLPCVDEEATQGEFNLKQIDAPMPEAPWNEQPCAHEKLKFSVLPS